MSLAQLTLPSKSCRWQVLREVASHFDNLITKWAVGTLPNKQTKCLFARGW